MFTLFLTKQYRDFSKRNKEEKQQKKQSVQANMPGR